MGEFSRLTGSLGPPPIWGALLRLSESVLPGPTQALPPLGFDFPIWEMKPAAVRGLGRPKSVTWVTFPVCLPPAPFLGGSGKQVQAAQAPAEQTARRK